MGSDAAEKQQQQQQHPVIIPLGALIQKFPFHGQNLVLSWPTSDNYRHFNSQFFGETIGRVANRISNARIDDLNGRSWDLSANQGSNCLHGGKRGWGKQVWDGPRSEERAGKTVQGYRLLSRHGDQGFPGTVEARVWYHSEVSPDERETVLDIEYEAEMVDAEPSGSGGSGGSDSRSIDEQEAQFMQETVVALTNHTYFNITDGPTIDGTRATLATNLHLPVDAATKIPSGEIVAFAGIEANVPFTLTADAGPIVDHCFILDGGAAAAAAVPLDTRALPLRRHVTLASNSTHTTLHVDSTEPAFQFYTGDGIDSPAVQGQDTRGPRAGIAIEPSRYVNAVNVPAWRHMVLLKRGERWGSRIRYVAVKT